MTAEQIDLTIQLLVVIVLMLMNGSLWMATQAICRSQAFKLNLLAGQGRRGAKKALDLVQKADRIRAQIREIIFLAGVFIATMAGAALIDEFQKMVRRIPSELIRDNSKDIGIFLLIILIPALSYLFTLAIPYRLAKMAPEQIAAFSSPALSRIIYFYDKGKKSLLKN